MKLFWKKRKPKKRERKPVSYDWMKGKTIFGLLKKKAKPVKIKDGLTVKFVKLEDVEKVLLKYVKCLIKEADDSILRALEMFDKKSYASVAEDLVMEEAINKIAGNIIKKTDLKDKLQWPTRSRRRTLFNERAKQELNIFTVAKIKNEIQQISSSWMADKTIFTILKKKAKPIKYENGLMVKSVKLDDIENVLLSYAAFISNFVGACFSAAIKANKEKNRNIENIYWHLSEIVYDIQLRVAEKTDLKDESK